MKLDVVVGWLGYALLLSSAFCVPAGVVAAATAHLGLAAVAFMVVALAAIVGIPTVAETVHDAHKQHRDIPRPL